MGMASRQIPANQLSDDTIAMYSIQNSGGGLGGSYNGNHYDGEGAVSFTLTVYWTDEGFTGSNGWFKDESWGPFYGATDAEIEGLTNTTIEATLQSWIRDMSIETLNAAVDRLGTTSYDGCSWLDNM